MEDVKVCIIDSEDVPRPYPYDFGKSQRIKYGDTYFFITPDNCISCNVLKNNKDKLPLNNYYKTREEAEFALERSKVIEDLKIFAYSFHYTGMTLRFYIRYDLRERKIFIQGTHNYLGPIAYFRSPQAAQRAINCIGVNRLLKYYFECPCDDEN